MSHFQRNPDNSLSGNTSWVTAFPLAVFLQHACNLTTKFMGRKSLFGIFIQLKTQSGEIWASNLDFICCYVSGSVSNLRGALAIPPPWVSQETRKEKCATEWKSQHLQPSQISTESIHSALGKTCNQALIMRARLPGKVLFKKHIPANLRPEKLHLSLFTLPEEMEHHLWLTSISSSRFTYTKKHICGL